MGNKKLSIIIPAYKAEPYIYELFDCLAPQITDEVEVMVIDDGSPTPVKAPYPWIILHRKENGGVSTARNYGIEHTKGEYISFIDADDLVAKNYVETLLNKIDTENFDYIELSWKSLPGTAEQFTCKLNSLADKMFNPSACTRAFKRSFIGETRFNVKKTSSEDENFTRLLDFEHGKRAIATEFMYFYRTNNPNSKSHRFWRGELDTRQIVYHYDHVTKDMTWLLEEIKKEDETNCVWLLTNQNDIPDLEKYCRVRKPHNIRGMELRGEPYSGFTLVRPALKSQVVLYISKLTRISGISTWIYCFCLNMNKQKDITVVYEEMDYKQLARLLPLVRCEKYGSRSIVCDTLIMCSIMDKIPGKIQYRQSVQVIHSCKDSLELPSDRDIMVSVSQASKDSFGINSKIIHNMMGVYEKSLLFISTVRIGATDKGNNNDRMIRLANILNKNGIRFNWLYFSDAELKDAPDNMIRMNPTLDILNWIKRADMLINLSDQEGFCYSIVEALCLGIPVITTDISVLPEIGFKDGMHGFILPFDFTDEDVIKGLNRPYKFKYEYDNQPLKDHWMDILGYEEPTGSYKYDSTKVTVQAKKSYKDMEINKVVASGEQWQTDFERAKYLCYEKHLVDIIG